MFRYMGGANQISRAKKSAFYRLRERKSLEEPKKKKSLPDQ
jgi:hypothetical protein